MTQVSINFFLVNDNDNSYIPVTLKTAQRLIREGKYFQEESLTIGDIEFLSAGEKFNIFLVKVTEDN